MPRSTRIRAALAASTIALLGTSALVTPAAQATTVHRTISIAASPSAALASTVVTFSGKLTHSPRGTAVRIQRKSGTHWVAVTSTKTKSAAGSYSVGAKLPATPGYFVYRAVALKKGSLRKAVSKSVTVAALRHTAFYFGPIFQGDAPDGGDMGVGGSLKAPCTGGAAASMQKKVGSAWVTVATGSVNAQASNVCTFQLTQHTSHSGLYRVTIARRGLNAGVTSAGTQVNTV